ncbi:MAG TPA: 2-C-methyl-D-erythritol 4-phosphate cytidylyltransferase [Pyrinomonadaceae bacterium]|jgi:2-C-methyl-D-erythritol 4-phosphate cytidylyltransferase
MNVAIIVAAGSGTRFGAGRPKQFLIIAGKPLLIHTLEKFENCRAIDRLILVLSEGEIANFQTLAQKFNLTKLAKIVAGGKTRAESVFNGLRAIEEETAVQIVAVHDGARPFVDCAEISATVEKAKDTGAACLTALVTDTIKEVADGVITGTIERAKLRRALTPQAFRFEILRKAFAGADLSEAATDECFLVERTGQTIAVVEGSAKNIKITTPEDWQFAEILLR